MDGPAKKPLIVIHGLLGSKSGWKKLLLNDDVLSRRDCYCVELRNHAASDHHDDMNYDVLSADIIRFADSMGLKEFDILGHSIGGRVGMTCAQKYSDRITGVISIDSAPVNECKSKDKLLLFFQTTL